MTEVITNVIAIPILFWMAIFVSKLYRCLRIEWENPYVNLTVHVMELTLLAYILSVLSALFFPTSKAGMNVTTTIAFLTIDWDKIRNIYIKGC